MSILQTKTFSINGATITVGPSTGWTETKRGLVNTKLIRVLGKRAKNEQGEEMIEVDDLTWMMISTFSTLLIHSAVEGDLGFVWPAPSDDGAVLARAMEAMDDLPHDAIQTWEKAIRDVDAPPGDPDLSPEAEGKSSARKPSPSA